MQKNNMSNKGEELFAELSRIFWDTEGQPLPPAKKYRKGDDLYREGQIPRGIFYLQSGSVKVTCDSGKKPVTLRYALSPDFVGYLSLIKHWDYVTTATAVENTEAYFIPRHIFFKAIHTDNENIRILLDILCNRISETDGHLLEILEKDVLQRLALLLLSLNNGKIHDPGHTDGLLRIPKKDLASILNVNPETLSRNLSRLSKEKAIRLHSRSSLIEIASKQRLLQLSRLGD